jgi:hypothetical protein
MLSASCRRTTILLLLFAILATPWPSVALPRSASAEPVPSVGLPSLVDGFWRFVRIVWSKTGCHLDPNGVCAPAPQPTPKEGCHIDPDGRCLQ